MRAVADMKLLFGGGGQNGSFRTPSSMRIAHFRYARRSEVIICSPSALRISVSRHLRIVASLVVLSAAIATQSPAQAIRVHANRAIDGKGHVLTDLTLMVEGGKITRVQQHAPHVRA